MSLFLYLSISFLYPRGLPPLTNTTPTLLYKSLKFRYPRLKLYSRGRIEAGHFVWELAP
ncbi:hypothetical protein L873DRAFT_1798192 [Choiromyces venosus 120613-1]|uniref:Uncharacterized protein n=1 Tax=Choiromyces venosus 120613-1 TaxID=1336337 RepID=A0A3N4KH67_9PEZI|nr:hypothetical protein L873DRAFT_1798192 [Choiromyces venosus 120613-1]